MGGGIGIPPMLELAKAMDDKKQILLGYRNKDLFLEEDLARYGDVYVATEDGSVGTKGNVMDIIKAYSLHADVIMACGRLTIMLRGVVSGLCMPHDKSGRPFPCTQCAYLHGGTGF